MASENELTLRRVVVALDVAADFAPAIELAATVAAGWRASLRGLFAEDERLQRLAALPFAQQLDPATAQRTPISAEGMRAEIDALMRRMRQELESVAERHGLPWSFDAAPGSIDRDEFVIESDELLAVGLSSRPIVSQMRLGSPWQRAVGRLQRRVLLVRGRSDANAPLAVLYDATEPGRRALAAAIRIAGACRRPLIIAVPEHVPEAQRIEAEALAQGTGVKTRRVVARSTTPGALARALPVPVDLLIVGGDGLSATEAFEQTISGAVLIV